ncbi:uncharacterized protein LOC142009367 isoform X1 [Carettochelys insculpta]|uniref:uncharacterized protein LOC142009367 isoform X1 n=1 Tax=Carettochelys insculpta TaxID=44489 RepID=UPI003EBA876F
MAMRTGSSGPQTSSSAPAGETRTRGHTFRSPWRAGARPGSEMEYLLFHKGEAEEEGRNTECQIIIKKDDQSKSYLVKLTMLGLSCFLENHDVSFDFPETALQIMSIDPKDPLLPGSVEEYMGKVERIMKNFGVQCKVGDLPRLITPSPKAAESIKDWASALTALKKRGAFGKEVYHKKKLIMSLMKTILQLENTVTKLESELGMVRSHILSLSNQEPQLAPQISNHVQINQTDQTNQDLPNCSNLTGSPLEACPIFVTKTMTDHETHQSTTNTIQRERTKAELKTLSDDTKRQPGEPSLVWLGRLILENTNEWLSRTEAIYLATNASREGSGCSLRELHDNNAWPITVPALGMLLCKTSLQALSITPKSIKTPEDLVCAIARLSAIDWIPVARGAVGLTAAQAQDPRYYIHIQDHTRLPVSGPAIRAAVHGLPSKDPGVLLHLRAVSTRARYFEVVALTSK